MEQIQFSATPSVNFERGPDGLEISGWSVHGNQIYQGGTIEVPASELKNIAESLQGKHLIKDHELITDNIVGRIMETKVGIDRSIGKSGVKYKATVDDRALEKKISKGLIDNVSIGFTLDPECSVCHEDFRYCEHWFDEAHVIARNCSCHEQSLVVIGADSNTTVEPAAAFVSANDGSDFKAQFSKIEKEANAMPKYSTTGDITGSFTVPSDNTGNLDYSLKMPTEYPLTVESINLTWQSSTEQTTDGENMEEVKELKEQVDALNTELAALKDEKDALVTELADEKTKNAELKADYDELSEKFEESETQLLEYVEAEKEAVKMAREDLIKEIVALQIEKGIITKEDEQAKFEELSEIEDDKHLEQTKSMLEAFKVKTEEGPKVGEFDGQEETGAMPEKLQFDMKDENLKIEMFKKMLNYPKKSQ